MLQSQSRVWAYIGSIMLMLVLLVTLPAFAADTTQPTGTNNSQATTNNMNATQKKTDADSVNQLKWNQTQDAQGILEHFTLEVPNLMKLLTGFAFVMGMYLMTWGIVKLKQYGEARTQMSSQQHLREPMTYLIVGALMIWLPSTVYVGLYTFWSNPNPYAYETDSNQWTTLFRSVFLVVELFGTIALIRGLLQLSKLGSGHGQPGAFAKGLTHIIGGLLCINLYGLVSVILVTFGFLS